LSASFRDVRNKSTQPTDTTLTRITHGCTYMKECKVSAVVKG